MFYKRPIPLSKIIGCLYLVLLAFASNTVKAQMEITNGNYEWLVPVVMESCNLDGKNKKGKTPLLISSLTGQNFSVVNNINGQIH
jgi:hypothetical protein